MAKDEEMEDIAEVVRVPAGTAEANGTYALRPNVVFALKMAAVVEIVTVLIIGATVIGLLSLKPLVGVAVDSTLILGVAAVQAGLGQAVTAIVAVVAANLTAPEPPAGPSETVQLKELELEHARLSAAPPVSVPLAALPYFVPRPAYPVEHTADDP